MKYVLHSTVCLATGAEPIIIATDRNNKPGIVSVMTNLGRSVLFNVDQWYIDGDKTVLRLSLRD